MKTRLMKSPRPALVALIKHYFQMKFDLCDFEKLRWTYEQTYGRVNITKLKFKISEPPDPPKVVAHF